MQIPVGLSESPYHISPLFVSVDGIEAEFFKKLSDFLSVRWERPYAGWVRARLSFAILRAAMLCVCVAVIPNGEVW